MRRTWVAVGVVATAILLVAFLGMASALRPAGLATALPAPRFVEEAEVAGIDHRYDGEFDFFVGGGVAAFDCNDDARVDLYLAGGEELAALFTNDSAAGGELRFDRLPADETDLPRVTGAYPIDIDSDGRVDLAVLRHGENVLLRGLGDCRFERANEAWGFEGGEAWTTAFSATWEAASSWPTLAIGHYLDEASTDSDRLCFDNELVRPNAAGDGFASSTSLSPGWCTLSMLFSDWNRSGRRDLRVSNDRHYYAELGEGQEQLWRVAPGEAPRLYTAEEGWQRVRIWGMGIASSDLTEDGYPEYYLTSQADNKLQVLADGPSEPRYLDMALDRGATAHRPYRGDVELPSTAWHAEFQDVNNDGFVDLFVSKGNVEAQPDYAARDPSNLLIGQADGSFVEGAEDAGIVSYARARGAAIVDLNQDGLLDLVVVNRRENVLVWRNVGSGEAGAPPALGNWVAVGLRQAAPNPDAIGAWIEARVGERMLLREVTVGGGHLSGQLGPVHLGIGDADEIEIRVTWPDGEVGPWLQVGANQVVFIERGATEAAPR
ncbi:MAG TPA: CRTAC1 family protein, partial [Candidatus Limnocylindria bacterium]|nr:CRTAC1 family protein [Candidatus Limnocylindria bacterium]